MPDFLIIFKERLDMLVSGDLGDRGITGNSFWAESFVWSLCLMGVIKEVEIY